MQSAFLVTEENGLEKVTSLASSSPFLLEKHNRGKLRSRWEIEHTLPPHILSLSVRKWVLNGNDPKSVNSLLTLLNVQDLLPYFLNLTLIPSGIWNSALPIRTWDHYREANPRSSTNILEYKGPQPLQFPHIQNTMQGLGKKKKRRILNQGSSLAWGLKGYKALFLCSRNL